MTLLDQTVKILQCTVTRVDITEIGDIIAKVIIGASKERAKPDGIYTERIGRAIIKIIKLGDDTRYITCLLYTSRCV